MGSWGLGLGGNNLHRLAQLHGGPTDYTRGLPYVERPVAHMKRKAPRLQCQEKFCLL